MRTMFYFFGEHISVNTEITDASDKKGIVFYDASCHLCIHLATRVEPWLTRHKFRLLPLQTAGCGSMLGLTELELLAEMHLLRTDGKRFGGVDALLEISRHFWWTWPIRQMARLPAMLKLFRAGYQWVARHRHCAAGTCMVAKAPGSTAFRKHKLQITNGLPLLTFPLITLFIQPHVPAWVFMWAMALALYAGCKWLTYRTILRHGMRPARRRVIAFLLAWPGMDAAEFLDRDAMAAHPRKVDWLVAAAKTMLGAILLWGIARLAWPVYPLLTGWIGMTGAILVLHFGLFHLLALGWQQAGVKAAPIMDKPLRSQSLAEFWGRRWNTAFNELAFRFTFRPFLRRTTPTIALLLVFGLSGLVHELVISLPAHGGCFLPTGYFLIQGLGMLAERTPPGKAMGLGRGRRGWLFTLMVTTGPVFWLFHPPFIKHIILPMLAAIGAT